MLWSGLIVAGMLFIAYANGANDNFKGVASLFGSGAANYRGALWWATATTFLGSLTAVFVSAELIQLFQGQGLLPAALPVSHHFIACVIFGAAFTVFLASKMGMPISTTHSLTGALVGSGLVASGSDFNFSILGQRFFLPLLVSPLIAVALVFGIYPLFKAVVTHMGLTQGSCLCVGQEVIPVQISPQGAITACATTLSLDSQTECAERYVGRFLAVNTQSAVDFCHYVSAGAVSFARGLNDTPKIVALGLAFDSLSLPASVSLVALMIAMGGLLAAGRVAATMSTKITEMNHGEGLVANLVTSSLVILSSQWGLPVSTTHVSCGALFGVGVANGQAHWGVIRTIMLAWLLTLPTAAALSAVALVCCNTFLS